VHLSKQEHVEEDANSWHNGNPRTRKPWRVGVSLRKINGRHYRPFKNSQDWRKS
jgi:hypothetical protein